MVNEYWILSCVVIGIELIRKKVVVDWKLITCCTEREKAQRGVVEGFEDMHKYILCSFSKAAWYGGKSIVT